MTEPSDVLEEYNEQLRKVNEALNITVNPEDRNNLLSLKNDLQQLISLTSTAEDESNTINNEYEMFMAEMEKEGAYKAESTSQSTGQTSSNIDTDYSRFKSLEGSKCKAPHCHKWGERMYHNALITSLLLPDSNVENVDNNIYVKVLFINPTHKEMLPCPYYLETTCRFTEDKCRFSHGEIVLLEEVQDYQEPDFAGLQIGSNVLAKQDDGLWHQGSVRRILKDKNQCIVKLEKKRVEVDVDFVDLLPFSREDDVESDADCSDGPMDEDERDDFVNLSLLISPSDEKLGSWEKYTKGIGSKLMGKMGYIIGTGLGRKGEGRIEPVTAVALPAGKSLDHCMELREKSGGDKNLFNVERKLKRLARKQEARNQRNYEREKKKVDVFNFLNDTLSDKSTAKVNNVQLSKSEHRKTIKAESSRNLNVELFKIEQRVKEIQGELVSIRQAMQRQSGALMQKQLREKHDAKMEELKHFENKESNIKNEQSLRNTTMKLTKF